MQSVYAFLADVTVAIHLGYVGFVVVGQLLILVGLLLKWEWVRNPWFRWIHLIMICIVAFEAMINFECPLTTWEAGLRRLAGQQPREGTFVGHLLRAIMFPAWPNWLFLPVYVSFALLVLGTFILAPPRWRRKTQPAELENTPAATM